MTPPLPDRCCPGCVREKPERIRRLGSCCCWHTPPASILDLDREENK